MIVRQNVAEVIQRVVPDWNSTKFICLSDLAEMRSRYVHSLLESEKGELSTMEQEVLKSLRENDILSSNVDAQFEQTWTFGERLADRIAAFGGSWTFLICFGAFIALWISMNTFAWLRRAASRTRRT